MISLPPYRWLIPLFIICVSSSCRPPVLPKPAADISIPETFAHSPETTTDAPLDVQWWKEFNNPDIDSLVENILAHNPDIHIASAKIGEIRSYFVQTKADRLPQLGGSAQASHQKASGYLTIPGADRKSDLYNLSFPASFELDLWGRLSSAEQAAKQDLLRAEEARLTVMNSVIAEGISLYLSARAIQLRIDLARKRVSIYQNHAAIMTYRYKHGLSSYLDMTQAESILAQAASLIPPLEQELVSIQQKLALIAGAYPGNSSSLSQGNPFFMDLPPISPGMPSDLLLNRPDIRAAKAGLSALEEKINVAHKSKFPQITLTGNFGYASPELENVLKPEAELWSLAMGISRPLFDGGRLKAGQRAAEARYLQGVAEYAKLLLTAFFEVENALVTRKKQLERKELLKTLKEKYTITRQSAENHYEKGLTDYTTVLNARQAVFQAEENLILTDLSLMTNRVTLYRALGAGFPDRP